MAVTSRSEDESSRETPPDRRSANGTVVQSPPRQASRGQIRRSQRVEALLLPMFAVCGPSTNRFAQLFPERLRPHLYSCAKPYGQAAMRARPSAQNPSREKLE